MPQTTAGLPYDECVGVSYQQLHEDPDAAIGEIVDRYHRGRRRSATRCVIVGSDYTDVATPTELSSTRASRPTSARRCVLAVQRPRTARPRRSPRSSSMCLAELAAQHAHTAAVVANRCDPAPDGRRSADRSSSFTRRSAYVLPEEPLLVAPSVAELQDAGRGRPSISGDAALLHARGDGCAGGRR